MNRNKYGAIVEAPSWVRDLKDELIEAEVFNFGIKGNSRDFVAINWDCYGFNEGDGLSVLQARQAFTGFRGFTQVRRNYYLAGHNIEDNSPFAHSVASPMNYKWALSSPENGVLAAQTYIWQVKPEYISRVIRQGDVGCVPVKRRISQKRMTEQEIIFDGSHVITGQLFEDRVGRVFSREFRIDHTKEEHEPIIINGSQMFEIKLGRRAAEHDFSRQTPD